MDLLRFQKTFPFGCYSRVENLGFLWSNDAEYRLPNAPLGMALMNSLLFFSSLCSRRGISKFYCGKSKSFTSLADARRSSSSKDLAKPENSYTRKRKSLPAFSITLWDKACSNNSRHDEDAAVSKRPANSSRTTVGRGHPESSSSSGSNSNSNGSGEEDHGYSRQLPPLHPRGKLAPQKCCSPLQRRPSFKTRSFSLTDLNGVASSSSSSLVSGVKQKMFH